MATTSTNKKRTPEQDLAASVGECYYDPLKYVMLVFPWGKKGTFLEHSKGPRKWQREFLIDLGRRIRDRNFDGETPVDPIEFATSSGHGIGKSALSAMLIKFIHDTRPYSKGVVTANTSDQLKTKTWAELGKWHKVSLTASWSDYFASRGNMALVNRQHPEAWRVDAQTCEERNSESFAGLHAANSTPFYIFDEASAVPEKVYEVSDGGLTDGEPMRFLFGNPTRSSGRFREACFGRLKHRFITRCIDSRTVEGTNKELLKRWEEDFGEDSDYFRVRARGLPPRAASTQFIDSETIFNATKRTLLEDRYQPLVVGVDVARFGDDKSVIRARHGRNANLFPKVEMRQRDTVFVARQVVRYCLDIEEQGYKIDAVFVDGDGVGGGVVDMLRAWGLKNVIEVHSGETAENESRYVNKRAEMWGRYRDWLKTASIPDDPELVVDSESIEYGLDQKNRIRLEKKEDMKARGLNSPDDADALVITFYETILPEAKYPGHVSKTVNRRQSSLDPDYDPTDW